ncbi:hypothetical protein [uncultured Leifsonia sp.]|uniref:hypothetical protein n=1 Tax=uncultured Leifsonia sp. TaxID=340359 RepID=UPI0028D6AC5A|nr:hypothetical protein [uncultured Leifsonia sp.]
MKLLQWCVLALTLIVGELPELPRATMGAHLLAGLWVGSSFVFLLRRRWLGALSSFLYAALSAAVALALLIQGVDIAWNVLTAGGSLGIAFTVIVASFQRNFRHSRW